MDEEGRSPQALAEGEHGHSEPHAEPRSAGAVLTSLSASDVLNMLPSADLGTTDPASRVFARVSSMSKSSEGAGGSATEQTPQDREAMITCKERGNKLFSSQLYGEAAAAYTEALRYARTPDDVATLLSNRSASYASLSRMYRSRPARRSECAALFDLDPTSLAQMAAKDADKAVGVRPNWAKGYSRQGAALFLLERYHEAREAYLEGLALEPTGVALQEGLREVQALLSGDADAEGGTPPAGGGTPPKANTAAAAAVKRQRTLGSSASRTALEDWDCALCAKLLFEPVTTPCGHTFCRECFARALDHKPRCPYCRTVLHVARDAVPVTITLASIISRAFPEEYEERRREAAGGGGAAEGAAAGGGSNTTAGGAVAAGGPAPPPSAPSVSLPLFVMAFLMPGETMALNIFEPRYRLMVRRVMEGSRRLGMAQARRDPQEIEDVAVEAEILECQSQPDGRYYLELVGRRRVRILSHGELDGYRVARCEPLQDTDPQAGTPEHAALPELVGQVERQMDSVLVQLRSHAGGTGRFGTRIRAMLEGLPERPPRAQAERFSLWAATVACLVLPDLDKAAMLRLTNTSQRLRQLHERLGVRLAAAGGGQSCALM